MSERTELCAVCGNGFTATHYQQRYCCRRCSADAFNARGKARRQAAREPKQCLMCPTDIADRPRSAIYCRECSKRRAANQHALRQPLHDRCKYCDKPFHRPKRLQFCTARCRGLHGRAQQVGEFPRTCIACGSDFVAIDARPNTCGRSCKAWARRYPGVRRVLACICQHCSLPFTARVGGQRYCSPNCAKRPADARRRAVAREVLVEDVSKAQLAKRDKWICQLCNKRVDKKLSHPHPLSSSIDHVVPISCGGEHSYANTQLAHLVCNVRKGNRTSEPVQLALVG